MKNLVLKHKIFLHAKLVLNRKFLVLNHKPRGFDCMLGMFCNMAHGEFPCLMAIV